MNADKRPVAVVTGGSAGLGLVIARTLLSHGYRIVIMGRDEGRLEAAIATCGNQEPGRLLGQVCDVTSRAEVEELFSTVGQTFQRLDVLVNCVGASDRGLVENLDVEQLGTLWDQNVVTALLCSQASIPLLEASSGAIVNIGSLAAKVGARYIGGYSTVKHALAGMTQQMRLELKPRGIHVALVSPGPIARSDAGDRYRDSIDGTLPPQASAPGGGARVKGLPPERVAAAVMKCIRRGAVDIVLPGHLRILIALGHAFPRIGDWLLLKFTSSK
ncbi:MAG: SDR family NAD(P)-dependent oxidoreductase [Rubripirellula sp.]|nr:SDR family NAD(P)-dependent oxidoreductase [Rubripirellula sp.]